MRLPETQLLMRLRPRRKGLNMKYFYISFIFFKLFKDNPVVSLSGWHQTADGWEGVVTDKINNDAYRLIAIPIKSEKVVVPETINQLLNLN
jgi:hypothetical protein